MAYIMKLGDKWTGPHPNKAGECCGNMPQNNLSISPDGTITYLYEGFKDHFHFFKKCWPASLLQESERAWKEVENLRAGKPMSCSAGTSEKMTKMGFVGLYLVSDQSDRLHKTKEVDTDVLQEKIVSGQHSALKPFNINLLQED